MVPLLSASTSLIISWSSDSDGFWPKERMTVPSSLVVICPSHNLVYCPLSFGMPQDGASRGWRGNCPATRVEGQDSRVPDVLDALSRGELTIAVLVLFV